MKLKIMQQGGGLIYTPFIPQAQAATGNASGSSSSSSESKLDPLDKEILGIMKDQNLLPSDVRQIYDKLIKFQKQTQHLTALGDDSYRAAMPGMLQILGLVNEAKYNKTQSDNIVKKMAEENAGADPALDAYGRMYVRNKDRDWEIEQVSISDFDREKHVPISNSELLSMRQRQFGFQDKFMDDLENMVGMTTTQKEIDRIINEIGSTETSAYIKNSSANRVIQALIQDGPEGIYKLSQKDRSEGLQPAWNAIYQRLPQNMRNLLRANAALLNTDPLVLIQDSVLRNTDTKTDVNYESTASKAVGYDTDPVGTKSSTQVKDTYPERLATGEGFDPEKWINIMPSNTGVILNAYAQNVGPVVKGENRMNSASLATILQQADGIGTITDAQSITFGNQLLNENEARMLMVDTNINMQRVWLPIKRMPDGRYTPDFEAQQKLEKVQKYIRDNNGQISDTYIENWLKNNLPSARWDSENKQVVFDKSSMMPFLVLHGIGTSKRLDFETNSPYLHNLSREEAGRYKDLYEMSINEDSRNGSVKSAKGKDISTGNRNKFYSGNIYIPISGSTIAAGIHNSQYFDRDVYTDITQKARINEQRQQMITNF